MDLRGKTVSASEWATNIAQCTLSRKDHGVALCGGLFLGVFPARSIV
jgi:hypothetical protein